MCSLLQLIEGLNIDRCLCGNRKHSKCSYCCNREKMVEMNNQLQLLAVCSEVSKTKHLILGR